MRTNLQHKYRNLERGQVVTFFALSFTFFLVLLTMIINAGILTRDRIKLQNSADLGALVGAAVQRENLDLLGELNQRIEDAYDFLKTNLNNPAYAAPCLVAQITCGQVGGLCQAQCNLLQTALSEAMISAYLDYHAELTNIMIDIVYQTNGTAFEMAKRTALAAQNLPVDIRRQVRKHHGGQYPDAKTMAERYDSGDFNYNYAGGQDSDPLNAIYKVKGIDEMYQDLEYEDVPMFEWDIDTKSVTTWTGIFGLSCGAGPTFQPQNPCTNIPLAAPTEVDVPARMRDLGNLTPAFAFAVSYSPQFNANLFPNKVRELKRFEEADYLGQSSIVVDPSGVREVSLFDRLLGTLRRSNSQVERKWMHVVSTSKPYGGEPTKGGYEGAKLIGVASHRSGDTVQELPVSFQDYMESRQIFQQLRAGDFLH